MLLRREDESNIEDINLISHIYIHSLSDTENTEETPQEQLPSTEVVAEKVDEIAQATETQTVETVESTQE